MEKKYTAESLKMEIAELEIRQKEEVQILKEELENTINNFKPVNIVKSLLKEFYSSENVLDELINTAVSVTSGFVTKKIVIGKSKNQLLKLFGLALQFGMTTVIAKKFQVLKENILNLVTRFMGEKKEAEEETLEPESVVEEKEEAATEPKNKKEE
jgi:hypothetical protein